MAIVSIPILGQASGKLSEIEFYRRNGVNVVRSSKLKRYKPNPLSKSVYQEVLSFLVGRSKSLYALFIYTMDKKKSRLSWLNHFVHKNYNAFISESQTIDFISGIESMSFAFNNLQAIKSIDSISFNATSVTVYGTPFPNVDFGNFRIFFVFVQYRFKSAFFHITSGVFFEPFYIDYFYNGPPFSGQDYGLFVVVHDTNADCVAQSIFAGWVQHG
jgi:hypothetical protein